MISIDLNLLRVFDVLYDECNVTRAATRLFLSQSAVSSARSPQGCTGRSIVRANSVRPAADVPRASACAAAASGAGRYPQCGCDTAVRPGQDRQRFVISAGPYFCTLIVPDLIALARKSAPGITLQIVNTSADLAQALDQQQVDIALGAFDRVPPRLRSEVLFHDEKAWAIGSHHPLAKQPFDHAAFLAWPRLSIGAATATDLSREPPAGKDLVSRVILETNDEADSPRLAQRASSSMKVYDMTTAIAVTAATDFVTLVARRYAAACPSSAYIRVIDFPRNHVETIELSMLWHSRVHDDPGSLWLRALIREAVTLSSGASQSQGSATGKRASAHAGKKLEGAPARARSGRVDRAAGS